MKTIALLANRFVNVPLMMHPPKLEVLVDALGPRLGIEIDKSELTTSQDPALQKIVAGYGSGKNKSSDHDFDIVEGVAVIPVYGTLMKRGTWMSSLSGCTSYIGLTNQLQGAVDDNGINSILLDIDSPGGEVAGCFELTDFIYSLRGKKPIYAVANDGAFSAAYSIASAADKIYVTRSGAVGSIGVFAMHAEQTELDKKIGVKYTYVFAGKQKVDGNPHEPLADRAKANMKKEIDREYGIFTETVARNRGVDVKEIVGTEAGLMWGDSAIPLLADQVGTLEDALGDLISTSSTRSIGSTTLIRGDSMAKPSEKKADEIVEKPSAKKADDEMAEEEMSADDTCDTDEDDDDMPKDTNAVKTTEVPQAAAIALIPGAITESRSSEDIRSISNLCKMAGASDKIGEFLTKKDAAGKFLSVADVSQQLVDFNVTESERTSIMSVTDVNNGNGKVTLDRLESEAAAFARANRYTETSNIYTLGKRKGTTPEQAYAQALEANPEVYADYKAKKDAAPMIAKLKAAGVQISGLA